MSEQLPKQIAKHIIEIHFGGNWTGANLKDCLQDLTWKEATTQIKSFNSIATLAYHVNYYVVAVTKVLQGEPLIAKDELSFNHPPINSQANWNDFLAKIWKDAAQFANHIEELPTSKIWENFTDEKYGLYYRNLHGIIEHMHYHLGQITLLKKMILADNQS